MRHAAELRRTLDDDGTYRQREPALRAPVRVLQQAERPGEDSVLGSRLWRDWAIWYKRLEAGTYQFPFSETGRKEVAAWELAVLLEGIDLKKGERRKRYRLPNGISSGDEERNRTGLAVGETNKL